MDVANTCLGKARFCWIHVRYGSRIGDGNDVRCNAYIVPIFVVNLLIYVVGAERLHPECPRNIRELGPERTWVGSESCICTVKVISQGEDEETKTSQRWTHQECMHDFEVSRMMFGAHIGVAGHETIKQITRPSDRHHKVFLLLRLHEQPADLRRVSNKVRVG